MRDVSVDVAGETAEPVFGTDVAREKPDGATDPVGEAGWYLQRERESRGLTLDDASAETGIHPYHLEAIEYGDMTRMPERMDAFEMIGTYAQYLGFDPEPLVEHYALFLPAPALAPAPVHPANPAPLTSAKVLKFAKFPQMPKFSFKLNTIPGGAGGLVASIAGAVFLFAGVGYMMLPGGSDSPQPAEQVAVADPAMTPTEDNNVDSMPTASTGEQSAEISIGEEPMPDDQPPVAAAPAPESSEDLAGTNLDGITSLLEQQIPNSGNVSKDLNGLVPVGDVALSEEGRQFGADNEKSRLTLKAKAPVWVRVEDAQGNVVMTQMLMKGDTYRVPDREGLVVIARDGGLLSYLIDGKEKGILGTPGEILVGRSLDIKSFGGKG